MESTLEILTGAEMYDPNNYPSPERVQIAAMILELERRMLAEQRASGARK
jgi:hypothetical protein